MAFLGDRLWFFRSDHITLPSIKHVTTGFLYVLVKIVAKAVA